MNRWRQEVKYGRHVPLSPDNLFSRQPETNLTDNHLAVFHTELVFRPHTKFRSLLRTDLGLKLRDWQYQSKIAKSRFHPHDISYSFLLRFACRFCQALVVRPT
jgi:hypothetical protein